MKFFEKKIGPFKFWWFVATWVALIIAIIVGSCVDLSISQAIANPNNFLGKTCESFGYLFGFSAFSAAGAMIFVGLVRKESKRWQKVLGIIIPVVLIALAVIFAQNDVVGKPGYTWVLPAWAGYLITTTFELLAFVGYTLLLDRAISAKEFVLKAVVIIVVIAINLILVNLLLKKMAYRPRYRALAFDNIVNGTQALGLGKYQNWWDWNFFQKPAWWDTQLTEGNITANWSDYVKSWPSGHTNAASLAMTLPILLSCSLAKDKKYVYGISYGATLFYALVVAYLRIRIGAHYLSDVAWGLFLVTIFIPSVYYIVSLIAKKPNLEYGELSLDSPE